ncbi:helix-turn-helix domain-containing protein, partial [Arthrospira platensis SPKY1]|nr:helix-turn-helix domain-containing protein [Arthrospira platensis SPKY1]
MCEHILEELARGPAGIHRELRPDALTLLRACAWPGNVRQLRNVLERAVMLADNPRIGASDLRDFVDTLPDAIRTTTVRPLAETVADCERRAIAEALVNAEGRAVEAARALGVGRATLYKKMTA